MVHLITGGSGSGKSEYAEDLLCRYRRDQAERLIYVATMYPYGQETKMKISRHRQMRRGKGFETIECYTGLGRAAGMLKEYESVSVLIECISNLVSNELYSGGTNKEDTADEIIKGIEAVRRTAQNVVIVTNEVNSEGLAYNPEMIRYKQVMGEVNCRLAKLADRVTEVVYGTAVEVKNRL
ncbi:MAG: bifunctional adenosylcobinamide kinase/adenosylcobinamide-phosphate guanylyltransferase [Dorea sp.]|nr:bifunctional adenosylcobinamide kinase/adenosylcobinamide-phosphate guanylyltransferase [Dorea sp.]